MVTGLSLVVLLTLGQAPTLCYEVFVRSFADSDGDGIGDLRGLAHKLDYITELGADCVWLMPVAESPSYHGYDVTNYYRVEPDYGTNADFQAFVREAHARGIRVLVDLVLNHMSSEHPFFQEALRDSTSARRDWFRWSSRPGRNWHRSPLREEYYYGFFWSGMPDLNWENPEVRDEAKRVAQFWIEEMGVDGFRLDAVRHLIESGDQDTNVPATHDALREFGQHVRAIAPQSFTIGEVWDSTGGLLPYYPDQLDAYFAFEVSDSILSAVRQGRGAGVLPPVVRLERAAQGRYAPFLRNHDQTRTVTFLGGDLAGARAAATLLLTLPGIPFIYYGEEIGMAGDKPDERLRTPMHWTDAPAAGFTRGTAWQALQPDSLTANVAAQERDSLSLLHWYRRLGRLRAQSDALTAGTLIPLETDNEAVVAYLRRRGTRAVLVIVNLGRQPIAAVTVKSGAGALPMGRHAPRDALGRPVPAFTVGRDGRITGYVPGPMAPRASYLLEIAIREPMR